MESLLFRGPGGAGGAGKEELGCAAADEGASRDAVEAQDGEGQCALVEVGHTLHLPV